MERVWVYQSNRLLTEGEQATASLLLSDFVAQWNAHGKALAGSFEIRYGLFIILKVDESVAMVTGCSIDKSVHLMQAIEQATGVQLFDRMLFAYRDGQGTIQVVSRAAFEALIASQEIGADTLVFNNMVNDAAGLAERWEVPLKDSWHARLFL